MRIKKLGSLLAHEDVCLLGSCPLDLITFPERKPRRVGQDRLLTPASCPPALMVLGQLKANSGMGQTSHSPRPNPRLAAAHLLSLSICTATSLQFH